MQDEEEDEVGENDKSEDFEQVKLTRRGRVVKPRTVLDLWSLFLKWDYLYILLLFHGAGIYYLVQNMMVLV